MIIPIVEDYDPKKIIGTITEFNPGYLYVNLEKRVTKEEFVTLFGYVGFVTSDLDENGTFSQAQISCWSMPSSEPKIVKDGDD